MRSYLGAMDLHYGCFDLVATSQGVLTYECNYQRRHRRTAGQGSRMRDWGQRAAALAGQLAELDGVDPRWAAVFAEVPRHVFVPRFYPHSDTPQVVDGTDP